MDDPPPSVVGKVRLIVEALGAERGRLGLSELAARTGLAKPTVHRLASELVEWGVVEHVGGSYRLGNRLFELGLRAPTRRSLRDLALPFLEDVHTATGETVHFAVPDGVEVVYLEKLIGRRSAQVPSTVADHLPMHATATGKCFLAFDDHLAQLVIKAGLTSLDRRTITDGAVLRDELRAIRDRHWAVEREEVTAGYASVAAPVFGFDSSVVGALSATTDVARFHLDRQLAPVRTAAAGLTRALGGTPPRG